MSEKSDIEMDLFLKKAQSIANNDQEYILSRKERRGVLRARVARIIGVSYNSDGCGTIGGQEEKVRLVADIASLEKENEELKKDRERKEELESRLRQFIESQRDIEPEIAAILNERFMDLFEE